MKRLRNNKKQKGYVLMIVLILTLVMAITATSTFTVVIKYMLNARKNADGIESINYSNQEVILDA